MKRLLLTTLLALFTAFTGFSQTQFWSDDFEDAGSPSSGTRNPSTSLLCGGPPATAYFNRVSTGDISTGTVYSGFSNSKFWAIEDIDKGPTCVNNSVSPNQNITWQSINISGKSGMSFKGLFAVGTTTAFDGFGMVNSGGTSVYDYMIIQYRIDAGAWVDILRFFPSINNAGNGTLAIETTGDSIAQGEGPGLTTIGTEYSGNIVGTGTTLELRMKCYSNSAAEEIMIDNFRLFETPACTAPVITANPPNRAICAGNNTTFTSNASGVTAFQWQVNTGSGFTDIVNGGVYSNATTNILTITGATAGMSGYLYRCRAMNGVASCFTNTNQATLTVSSVNTSSASQTNVACNGAATGAAAVSPTGGIAPYTYSWSPAGGTGSIASGLSAGSYTVTVTDNIGCQGTRNYTITQPPVLNGSTVVTNVACFGGNTGAINLTPSGGTPGYTFSWSGGVTTEDRTSLAAGTYTVTITDANACTRTVSGITVTQPASAVSATTVVTNVACFGGNTGAINLTPTGGVGPYTFNWAGGITTEDRTGLVAGTYSVTITDANGCTGTVSPTVTQPASAVSGTTVVTNVACFGGNTGAINLTPTGGVGPYTFNWAGGITTEDRTGLVAGTYSVTITDANGCTGTVSPTVTQPTSAVSGTTVVTNVACFGGSTGAINLTPTGGVGPYTFNWGGGVTTEDRTGLTAGTYSVTITDANGCTGTVSPTVTQPTSAVSGTTVVTNVACFGGSTGAINLTPTGGVGPYTFNWGGGVTTEDRTSRPAGTYSVTITDVNGCTGTVNATITQPASAVSGTTVVTNVACFGGNTGAINLTPTGGVGPYTFNWSGGITTEDRTGLVAGTYSVTITDANGCTGTVSPTVTQPTAAVSGTTVVTNVACNGGNTGAINLTPTGGVGPYTFNWSGGITTEDRTGLVAGAYSVTITDANGCTGTVSPTVTQPTAISVTPASQTNISCNGGSNGAAAINTPTGGAGGYTYNWTPGNPTGDGTVSVTGLSAGTWTCTVTDANACTASQSFTVTQPTAISVTPASQTNIACNGGSNGAAAINTPTGGAGGYTYNWTPGNPTGDGTISVTGLSAGTWTCTVTDANACTASQSFTVTQPTAISVTPASQTNIACNGGSNGAAAINTPTGGAGGYTYNWTPGNPTGDGTVSVTGLSAGTWTCTVTDANGCTASQAFTVTQPTAISVTPASQTNIACNGGSNGAAAINAPTGGAGAYTYDWAPGNPTGDGTVSVTGLAAGTWTCTVTDANGCTASQAFTVTQPTAISVTAASQTNVSCNGGSNGAAAINAPTGGAGAYTYDWAPGNPTGDGTVSVTGLAAGTWTCTVTDANGCTANQSFTITEPALISSSVTETACGSFTLNGTTYNSTGVYTQNLVAVNGCDSIVTLNLTINNATSSTTTMTQCDSYMWTDGTTYTVSGTYTQVLTNSVGCDSTATLVLTINNSSASTTTVTECDSYMWTNGTTYTVSGTYTQVLTNSVGCDSTATLVLTINNSSASTTTVTECDSYTWTDGLTYTVSGTYTQDLTNAAGCDSTATLVLTINNSSASTTTVTECDSYTWTDGLTYTVSGTYTQDLTNAAGCDSTATLVLTINNSSASTTTVTECDSYTWTDGLTYTVSGTYTQDLTNSVGCDSTATLVLTINTTPTATATDNGDATITASSGSTYQWINCTTGAAINGATAQTFVPSANGSYSVVIANGDCSDTSACVTINNVGIEESTMNSFELVNVYPNPFNNALTVVLSGNNEPAQLVILDALGRTVFVASTSATETTIDVSNFASGMYVLKVISGDKTVSRSITK